jgi:NAD(P)H-dependent FMN reductase
VPIHELSVETLAKLRSLTATMKITLISGTNRPGNATRRVVDHLATIYSELGQPATVLDLQELPPEIFLPEAYAKKPAGFARFTEAVLKSDGLHVVTPEYNGGMPGALKYFIDMLPFPESFEHRPVCFTGVASGVWGALRPVEQLQGVFGYRNAYVFPNRVFLANIKGHFSVDGKLTNHEWLDRLRKQAAGFTRFIEQVRPESTK